MLFCDDVQVNVAEDIIAVAQGDVSEPNECYDRLYIRV